MEPAGLRLKKIRLERGLSLEEVHKKTKIHLSVLKAIEEDSLINFNPVYIKGFLKIYCQFLRIDPKEYITGYKEPRSTVQLVPTKGKKQVFLSKPASLRFAFFKQIRVYKQAVVILLATLLFIFLLFNLGRMISTRRLSAQQRIRIASVKTLKAGKTDGKNKTQKKQEIDTSHVENISKADVSSIVRLSIRARENCWIQLKSDGKVVFYGTLVKGRSESWHAKNKIELSLGNAGVVDLEVNGKPIYNLGRRGQAIKNINITKEGFSIAR
jgi:cytoskeletal protein RodZ